MSTGKLYQEAINEANDLVKMAEERARDKLIESVMPRIRSLLEKRILESDDDDEEVDDEDLDLILSQTAEEQEDASSEEMDTDSEEMDAGFDEIGDSFASSSPVSMSQAPTMPASDPSGDLDIKIPRGIKKVTLTVAETKNNGKNKTAFVHIQE